MSIEIVNESGVAADGPAIVDIARHVLREVGVHPLAELSVLLVDENHMSGLHERWMGEPGPTDVLAFPMDDLDLTRGPSDPEPSDLLLGDVVLCPSVAAAQAVTAGHSTDDELALLTTHGILHLLGYDHGEAGEEREMFALQDKLLTSWRETRSAERLL
ncbi:MAG: rRNA maturation RNase YbeY [Mycobacteriales bacterium]|nr:MAG: rRNA maturation RNase YbeY [Pseudonocardiales bacterium]